jgi:hypothetical protein
MLEGCRALVYCFCFFPRDYVNYEPSQDTRLANLNVMEPFSIAIIREQSKQGLNQPLDVVVDPRR